MISFLGITEVKLPDHLLFFSFTQKFSRIALFPRSPFSNPLPIFCWSICFFLIRSFWWFIYSECYSFVYCLCKCFLPICHLLFNFVRFIVQHLFFNVNQTIISFIYQEWLSPINNGFSKDINPSSGLRLTTAFNFRRWMLKWDSFGFAFVWRPKRCQLLPCQRMTLDPIAPAKKLFLKGWPS